jgi:hypothetical protein
MYGKRSAWFLGAIAAPPHGNYYPTLADIQIALQAELPTPRAAVADTLWAVRDGGVDAETVTLSNGSAERFVPHPSTARTVAGGFATICKFFPGTMSAAAELEEALFLEILGPPDHAPQVFDDEYISTGGQLYELTVGRDRFVADLRPLLIHPGNSVNPLCCHPYDLCTWIIAQEAGVQITSGVGGTLISPLDTETPVSWIGYANETIRDSIELPLQRLLKERMENV